MKFAALILLLISCSLPLHAAEVLKSGMLNQRPIALTATLCNPILQCPSDKSAIFLTLAMGSDTGYNNDCQCYRRTQS